MELEREEGGEPLYAYEYAILLEQARSALDQRRKAYPDWVAKGRLTQEEADYDIRGWELLVAEWTWIASTGAEGERPGLETLHIRVDAVALSLERIEAEFERGNRSHAFVRQAHLVQAIHWHLHRRKFAEPAVHHFVRLTQLCRADAEARRQERNAA